MTGALPGTAGAACRRATCFPCWPSLPAPLPPSPRRLRPPLVRQPDPETLEAQLKAYLAAGDTDEAFDLVGPSARHCGPSARGPVPRQRCAWRQQQQPRRRRMLRRAMAPPWSSPAWASAALQLTAAAVPKSPSC
jgi:hypothetical protein